MLPKILVAILAKQQARMLPLYLDCLDRLDYPKDRIVLYVRTNNNTDRTAGLLQAWLEPRRFAYDRVIYQGHDLPQRVERFARHDWNDERFAVLGQLRHASLQATLFHGCEYYFTADCDNFLLPHTLRTLVALQLPIVAPLLQSDQPRTGYSNFHYAVDAAGYFRDHDMYFRVLRREVRGIIAVDVVHCTYLVRADVIPQLAYCDDSHRHEYVIFSASARKAGIQQYLDNREIYGFLTFGEDPEECRKLLHTTTGTNP